MALDPNSIRRWRIQAFLVTWIAYAGFWLTRRSLAIAKIGLAEPASAGGMNLTNYDFAWIDASYLVCYTCGQFLWGPLSDRIGTKKVVLTGMFFSILLAVGAGTATDPWTFTLLNALQGVFQSSGWGPLCKSMGAWFPPP